MEGDQNLSSKEVSDNEEYTDKELAGIKIVFEGCFGLVYLDHYEFDSDARKVHDEVVKSIPAYMIQKRSDFQPVKALDTPLVCQDGRPFSKTLNGYKKHDIIMNCFGELKVLEREQVEHQMFVTDFGMVLDGSKRGNLWRYVKESCVPNCHFIQRFVKNTDNDTEVPEFLCSLVAKRDIKPGETLRVDFNHLRGLESRDYDCSCEEDGCVGKITAKHRCGVPGCRFDGHGFSSATALKNRIVLNHSTKNQEPEPAKSEPSNDEKYKCLVKNCGKKFKCSSSLYRHIREKHSTIADEDVPTCPKCAKTFARKQSLDQHLLTACKGKKPAKEPAKKKVKKSTRKAGKRK